VTKHDWRLHVAVTTGGKQLGKKPQQAGTPSYMFNSTAKARLRGRSIEIPGG